MIAVFFTYSGWFAAAYVGSEVKRPGRNVPLALIAGTLIIALCYTAVNAVYLYSLSLADLRQATDTNVARLSATQLFGPSIASAIGVAIVLSITSCMNSTIITGARVCFAMGEDGVFLATLKKVHPRFETPHAAIVIQAIITCALVLLGTFNQLLSYVVFAMLLTSMCAGAAHIVLRVRRPAAERSYRTFAYPLVPIVFVVSYGFFAFSIALEKPVTSLVGLGLALTAVPFYFWWRRKR
jgi:APA family basic amino acid/polyamine antiporter